MKTQEKQRWQAIQLEDHARGALASHCLRAHWCLTFWGSNFPILFVYLWVVVGSGSDSEVQFSL